MKVYNKDKKSSLFFLFFGVLTAITAYRFGLGSLTSPGPGFLPVAAGLVMILLSGITYLQGTRSEAGRDSEPIRLANLKIVILTLSLFVYALFLKRIGFILTNFLFLVFFLQLLRRGAWYSCVLVSTITMVASYVIFVVWLKVQLPTGFLGF